MGLALIPSTHHIVASVKYGSGIFCGVFKILHTWLIQKVFHLKVWNSLYSLNISFGRSIIDQEIDSSPSTYQILEKQLIHYCFNYATLVSIVFKYENDFLI